MPDEPIIREKAREAILSGRLPAAKPSRMVYGHSAGATCAVCGYPVSAARWTTSLNFEQALRLTRGSRLGPGRCTDKLASPGVSIANPREEGKEMKRVQVLQQREAPRPSGGRPEARS
jgi:hypothetical protein